jgi:FdhE protein
MPLPAQDLTRLMDQKLAAIRAADILPEELVALVARVLPLQLAARERARVELPDPSACADAGALFAGAPLILRQDFPCDMAQARELFPALLDLLAQAGGPAATAAEDLRAAIAAGELDVDAALAALPAGHEALFATWRERLPESPRALDFLVISALWPGLNRAAEQLAPRLPEDLPYERGGCPLCGSLPYISFLDGKEGRRIGVCSFCGFEHRIRRIGCPACGQGDAAKLRQFRVAEYPGVRVDVCDTCNMYVKTLDFRELDAGLLPALDDMVSVALDVLAQSHGFRRPTLSAWGF